MTLVCLQAVVRLHGSLTRRTPNILESCRRSIMYVSILWSSNLYPKKVFEKPKILDLKFLAHKSFRLLISHWSLPITIISSTYTIRIVIFHFYALQNEYGPLNIVCSHSWWWHYKTFKPCFRWLFETVESFLEMTYLSFASRDLKTRRQTLFNFFSKVSM